MDLLNRILSEHTRKNCLAIVKWVGRDQSRFNELFSLFLSGQYRVSQRAAWPMSYCAIAHPELMRRHFGKLVRNLQKAGIHDAIKRNTVRLLQKVDIPEKYEGIIMDTCFRYAGSVSEPVAVKVFSLSVLERMVKKYPDILPELKMLVEDTVPYQAAAFQSRAKKIAKSIRASEITRVSSSGERESRNL
jgi:hypothetical protein